jgi:predicted nucleic acid-binding protein
VSLVCFDSNFVVWGVKRQATPGQEDNINKAVFLLDQLGGEDKQVVIPSIVLGEVLASFPPDLQPEFVAIMEQNFIVAPYDSVAAVQYARMWQNRARDTTHTRDETKADYMIAAIAVANGCEAIYSNDSGLRRFASEHIQVIGIEELTLPPEQGRLFT